MDNLEELISGQPESGEPVSEPTAEPTPAEVVQPDAEPGTRERDEKGRFKSKDEQPMVPLAALHETRDKVRDLEARLATMSQPPPQPQGPPDRWEDPEGYDQWLIGQASATAEQRAMHAFQYQRIQLSAEEAKGRLPDYVEKIGVFEQMAQGNPLLMEQMFRAQNPAQFAYDTAKTHLDIQQYGGIEKLIAARVQEALKSPQIPNSLAGEQSARGFNSAGQGPPSLDDILKG